MGKGLRLARVQKRLFVRHDKNRVIIARAVYYIQTVFCEVVVFRARVITITAFIIDCNILLLLLLLRIDSHASMITPLNRDHNDVINYYGDVHDRGTVNVFGVGQGAGGLVGNGRPRRVFEHLVFDRGEPQNPFGQYFVRATESQFQRRRI